MKSGLIIALIAAGFSLFNFYSFLSNGNITALLLALLWGWISFRNIRRFLKDN